MRRNYHPDSDPPGIWSTKFANRFTWYLFVFSLVVLLASHEAKFILGEAVGFGGLVIDSFMDLNARRGSFIIKLIISALLVAAYWGLFKGEPWMDAHFYGPLSRLHFGK